MCHRNIWGKKEKASETDENNEMINRNPSPISACDVSIWRVELFDSTQTQASSKYFLFNQIGREKYILDVKVH